MRFASAIGVSSVTMSIGILKFRQKNRE
jgi:hypothetical protein